jgi:hypothetical protein
MPAKENNTLKVDGNPLETHEASRAAVMGFLEEFPHLRKKIFLKIREKLRTLLSKKKDTIYENIITEITKEITKELDETRQIFLTTSFINELINRISYIDSDEINEESYKNIPIKKIYPRVDQETRPIYLKNYIHSADKTKKLLDSVNGVIEGVIEYNNTSYLKIISPEIIILVSLVTQKKSFYIFPKDDFEQVAASHPKILKSTLESTDTISNYPIASLPHNTSIEKVIESAQNISKEIQNNPQCIRSEQKDLFYSRIKEFDFSLENLRKNKDIILNTLFTNGELSFEINTEKAKKVPVFNCTLDYLISQFKKINQEQSLNIDETLSKKKFTLAFLTALYPGLIDEYLFDESNPEQFKKYFPINHPLWIKPFSKSSPIIIENGEFRWEKDLTQIIKTAGNRFLKIKKGEPKNIREKLFYFFFKTNLEKGETYESHTKELKRIELKTSIPPSHLFWNTPLKKNINIQTSFTDYDTTVQGFLLNMVQLGFIEKANSEGRKKLFHLLHGENTPYPEAPPI